MRPRQSITAHLNDLGKRDINVAYDCIQWLTPTQREIDRQSRPKRIANRYIAACMIVEASKNAAFAKEVLDRTEGKVADKLITVDYNDLIRQLEAARQRVLNRGDQHQQPVLEGQEIGRLHMSHYQTLKTLTPGAGDGLPVSVSEDVAEEPQPVRDATNPAGSHQGVSSNKLPYGHTGIESKGSGGELGRVAEDVDSERILRERDE